MNEKEYKAYWHAWHLRYLLYFLTPEDHANRVEEIKTTKPQDEIPTRLRLFQQVRGEIPIVLIQAGMKWAEAHAKLEEAYREWGKADAKQEIDRTKKEWEEADAEYADVYMKYLPQIEKLHTEECGCTEWDGKKVVFPKGR